MTMSSNDKIKSLFSWCLNQTKSYKNVNITNFTTSWRNGLGFCAIFHRYGPEYIDYEGLSAENVFENCQIAFQTGEKYFGIPALLDARDMVALKSPDRLSIITYLLQCYNTLVSKRPKIPSIVSNQLSPIENISDERQLEDNIHGAADGDSSVEERYQLNCEICSRVIYFLEKLSVSDKYYHRACYRQSQLSNLKARNKTLERPPPKTSDDQTNKSNITIEKTPRKSRLQSLSPEARERISKKTDRTKPSNPEAATETPTHSESQRSRSDSLSNETDESNKSHNDLDNNNTHQRLRSLSPHVNTARPPSLDGFYEQISVEKSPTKSLGQFSTDLSSPSASSTHYVSINASSTDSLPKSLLGNADQSNADISKRFIGKLYPGSLNASTSSLNSSSGKKRRAPPPPTVVQSKNVDPKKLEVTHKVVAKPKNFYPEDLNPFAEFGFEKPNEDDLNPFAEFMTEEEPNNNVVAAVPLVKPNVKPRKRAAPKLPPNHSVEVVDPVISTVPSGNEDDAILLTRVTTMSDPELSQPCLPESSETEVVPKVNLSPLKDASETSFDSSLSPVVETKHEITQTNELVERPKPLKRMKKLLEKAQSIDSINSLISAQNNKHKPPAPPRPPPAKREVRGDTSYEFIPYESIYSELEEVNKQQSEMEDKGRSLQLALKKINDKDEGYEALLQEWLDVVEKKNVMYSKEHHLHEILRRQELEDRHSDLEYELRVLMGKQESLKTAAEKAREEELINQILDTVNARAKLAEEEIGSPEKAATNDLRKKKSTLNKMFSGKHRSNSLGKTIFRFTTLKKSHKTLKPGGSSSFAVRNP